MIQCALKKALAEIMKWKIYTLLCSIFHSGSFFLNAILLKCFCFLFIGICFKWARLTFCFHHLLQGKSSLCIKGVYLMLFTILWLHTATELFSLLDLFVYLYVVFRPQHPNNRMVLPIYLSIWLNTYFGTFGPRHCFVKLKKCNII
jgi:hypothetical protein